MPVCGSNRRAGPQDPITTPQMASQLRRVAAAAREELIGLAADQGKVDRATLAVKDGKTILKPILK